MARKHNSEVLKELKYIKKTVRPLSDNETKKSILITGSTDGIGLMTAQYLKSRGHTVIGHARNQQRANDLYDILPAIDDILIADFTQLSEVEQFAKDSQRFKNFDTIIHNAGIHGGTNLFSVNVVAPYVLTLLMDKPKQLIYLSSMDHGWGKYNLDNIKQNKVSYADTKLHIAMIALAFDQAYPEIQINPIEPGWVPTNMGGQGAPDDMAISYMTQVNLIEEKINYSGTLLVDSKPVKNPNSTLLNPDALTELMDYLAERTGLTV
ncbi:SDR family NAD(P)-dependent oxidoreductase [Aerococcaceae bacterium DSM 111176]|nr:SDR family NAD(P)-dependent oxidoreductase [Aerococcaceae bacterium DSM 111176]